MPLSGGTAGAHDDAMHQGNSKRDVVDGVAGLGPAGNVLAVGPDLELTRDASENIEIVERTSGNIVFRWTRIGINDFECRVNCGGVACIIQNDGMKDIAGGIAGLDANELLDPVVHAVGFEEYSNHFGATDDFTQSGVTGNGTANTDAANHEMDLSTGVGASGHARFETKDSHAVSSKPIVANFVVQNIVDGAGGQRYSMFGLANLFSGSMPSDNVAFFQKNNDSWVVKSTIGGSPGEDAITALSNGDICTIVYITGTAKYFVNGVLVGTRTSNLPAAALKAGAGVYDVGPAATTARELSIDMMSMKRYV